MDLVAIAAFHAIGVHFRLKDRTEHIDFVVNLSVRAVCAGP